MPALLRPALPLAALLVAAPALAQQSAPPAPDPAPGFLTRAEPGSLRASKLVGVKVIGMDHVRVGEIEDVLLAEDGRVRAVVIGVGGFLGIGQKSVAVPFDRLAWNTGAAAAGAPPSHTTPDRAPSDAAAQTAGPQTMPGANVTDQALAAVPAKRSGTVDDATGSVAAADPSRGRATVLATGDGTVAEAEIRLTKAQLQAAPRFTYEAAR
ncbi:PRC-barrel domain-containing protein [Methylobacterium nonmethylotrophicum]|uniref:PRC-barrel domain containing protein n=1 Tax=Methylobacterium nonmethylotrophicum TaxID=1141884 RepID=A0A4Z0NUS5_9HYPH|nr:PRC-barrel domain-containing protein [Methylobacterium nonmethylotrophicum]TGE01265.1 PRC-barrel domain containing protein [Methylobacterium nonmethylotrophicum]